MYRTLNILLLCTCSCNNNPTTSLDRPWGFQEVEAPRFQDNRLMKVVRSALRTGRLFPIPHPQEIFLVFICVRGWVNPRTIVQPKGIYHRESSLRPSGLQRSASNNCATTCPTCSVVLVICLSTRVAETCACRRYSTFVTQYEILLRVYMHLLVLCPCWMILMHGHGLFKTKDSVAMAQEVSCRSVTAEDRVRYQVGPCGFRCGKRGTWTGFFSRVQWGMLQRTVFVNKIRMLQRTLRNSIGRRSTRVRMTFRAFPLIRALVIIIVVIVCKVQVSV